MEKVVKTLDSMTDGESYTLDWGKVTERANELGAGHPALPRKRNKPARFSDELDNEVAGAGHDDRHSQPIMGTAHSQQPSSTVVTGEQ